VFVAGTVTFNPKSEGEPFDMTSNMSGVAQASPGAYRSVVEAMHQAGITSKSPIVLNGYSQGGLIATLVASSNKYNVKGLVTFGSPSGQVPVAANIPTLTVRHTEDIVPALGGREVNEHAVVVYRTLFDDRNPPTDLPVAGHDFGFYKQTAAIIDRSTNPELRAVLDPINHFEDGATTVTTTMYKAHRLQP
jgi:pimeloyl-ACP methyl ester carboxylesterase